MRALPWQASEHDIGIDSRIQSPHAKILRSIENFFLSPEIFSDFLF